MQWMRIPETFLKTTNPENSEILKIKLPYDSYYVNFFTGFYSSLIS